MSHGPRVSTEPLEGTAPPPLPPPRRVQDATGTDAQVEADWRERALKAEEDLATFAYQLVVSWDKGNHRPPFSVRQHPAYVAARRDYEAILAQQAEARARLGPEPGDQGNRCRTWLFTDRCTADAGHTGPHRSPMGNWPDSDPNSHDHPPLRTQ